MKKTILQLTVFFVAVFILSCKDDDSDSGSSSVIGKWEAVSVVLSNCSDPTDNEIFTCSPTVGTGICYTLEIRSDKTFKMTRTQGSDVIGEGSYFLNGPGLSLNFTIANPYNRTSPEFYMTTVSGSALTTTWENDDYGCVRKATYKKIN